MPPFRLVIYGSLPTISRVGPGQCIRPLCRAQARDSFDFILLSRNCGCQGETCSTRNLSRVVDPTFLQSVGGDSYHSSTDLGWNPANSSMLAHVFRLSRSLNVFHISRVSLIPFVPLIPFIQFVPLIPFIRLAPLTVSLYTFILVIPFIICIPCVPFILCIPFIPFLPFIPFIQSKPFVSFVPSVSVIQFIP